MESRIGINIQILVLFVVCVFGHTKQELCGQYHSEEMHFHVDTNGTIRCCVQRLCPKGTHGQMCVEDQPQTTQCVACGPEGFSPRVAQSFQKMQCQWKRICSYSSGIIIKNNGSTTSDRECMCDLNRGYIQEGSGMFSLHCRRVLCPAGQELHEDGQCGICDLGTFKASNEDFGQCRPMTNCRVMGLEFIVVGNETHDNVCESAEEYTTTTIDPAMGALHPHNSSAPYWLIGLAVVILFIAAFIVCIFIVYWKRKYGCGDSSGSPAEKQTLDQNMSLSDVEESDNKANLKGPKDLTITIPSAPVQESGDHHPKSSTTPDSGIVSDLKLNGQGYAPVYTSSPVFGPNYPTVECDSIPPAVECQDGPPLVDAPPSFPTRRPSGGTEGAYKEPPLSGVHDKSLPTYLVIQNDGPVYLQCGSHNQLSAQSNAPQTETTEHEFVDDTVASYHTTV